MGEELRNDEGELQPEYAFVTGVYGNGVSHKVARTVTMSDGASALGGLRPKPALILLPYSRMKAQFPGLEWWSVLLPVCRAWRMARALRSGKLDACRHMMDDGDAGREDVGRIRREQKAGGFEKSKRVGLSFCLSGL